MQYRSAPAVECASSRRAVSSALAGPGGRADSAQVTMDTQSLNGTWRFRAADAGEVPENARAADAGEWRPGTVPGDVYSDLLENGVIDDPYDEDAELGVQWVGETDWVYERRFPVDDDLLAHDRQVLECLGVDTVAEVRVNGEVVGETNTMHRRYEFDLGDVLEDGENRIQVRFRSPVEYAAERQEAHPYEVPALRYPVDQPGRNFIRKAQCHFGWDWGPCLPGVGLWRDVRLLGYSSPRIRYTTTEQTHADGDVDLRVRVGVDAPRAGTYDLTASVAGETETREVVLEEGEREADVDLTVADPDLWWPNGYGDQPLFDLEVSIADGASGERGVDGAESGESHIVTDRIGFRDLRLVRDPGEDGGESFSFEVNGVPVFAKGANWIPTENLRGRVDEADYEDLLSSAVEANMNTVRVWGGGYYELDTFYETCDELGLLVWQDVMFACALYPATEDFLETVEAEVRYQVRRLANHPSLALWCGNNENEMSLVDWFEGHEHIEEFYEDYRRLNRETIAPVVEAEDPSRTFWPGSPSSGGLFGEDAHDPHDQSRGDIHYWDVWHSGAPFADYLDVEPRFVSEFGYQSFASVDCLSAVVPADQLNPTAPIMEHHQRNPGGNGRILQRMADHFRIPDSFEDLVYLSQVQQALAMQTAIEHWRRLRPYCMGTLYWQLNDLWPCASWSSIEYGGRWKALQYVARRIYAPVLVSTVVEREREEAAGDPDGISADLTDATVEVWLTSDRPRDLEGTLAVEAYTLEGDRVYASEERVTLESGVSQAVASLSLADDLAGYAPESLLVRAAYAADGEETYPAFAFFEPFKRLALPDPGLSVAVEGSDVVLETERAALFVGLAAPSLSGHFSDAYFHLAPGERRRVSFVSEEDVSEGTLREALEVTHLSETYPDTGTTRS